ncbi:hypothetical protein LTR41_011494 [Exophiala xenobiotica]|nr:hypothetical protein LTR41_011494 [Exophiala xenobiotica]
MRSLEHGPVRYKTIFHMLEINACIMLRRFARYLQGFRRKHGDASYLMGVALHCIATAITTFIAAIAERNFDNRSCEMYSLKICVRTLGEMEKAYLVARRVRKITQLIIRVCHLEKEYRSSHDLPGPAPTETHDSVSLATDLTWPNLVLPDGNQHLGDLGDLFVDAAMSGYSPFDFGDVLPTSAQLDIFHTFDTEIAMEQRMCQGAFG